MPHASAGIRVLLMGGEVVPDIEPQKGHQTSAGLKRPGAVPPSPQGQRHRIHVVASPLTALVGAYGAPAARLSRFHAVTVAERTRALLGGR